MMGVRGVKGVIGVMSEVWSVRYGINRGVGRGGYERGTRRSVCNSSRTPCTLYFVATLYIL